MQRNCEKILGNTEKYAINLSAKKYTIKSTKFFCVCVENSNLIMDFFAQQNEDTTNCNGLFLGRKFPQNYK